MAEPAKAAVPTPAVKFIPPVRPKTLKIGSLQLADQARNHWVGEPVHVKTTLEEMLAPEFWVHDAKRLRPRDEIEVWAEDGTWLEIFIVRSVLLPEVGRPVVKVARKDDIPHCDDDKAEPTAVNGMYAKWRGPHSKWGVVRESDQAIVKDKFETREDAEAFLSEFGRAA